MIKFHLIMPMGGRGSRFSKFGYDFPKPLLEINGRPFFFWATQSIVKYIDVLSLTFVILKEHVDNYKLDVEIRKYYPDANIVILPEVLNGAVLTCEAGLGVINDDNPVVFNDCDHIFRSTEFENFCAKTGNVSLDGALLTFNSDSDKYSYAKLDEFDNVTGTVEKVVVSNRAICGCYYFGSKNLFMNSMEKYLDNCAYQEYFVSGLYNIMADEGKTIKTFNTDFHVPFGVPEEYEEAKDSPFFNQLI